MSVSAIRRLCTFLTTALGGIEDLLFPPVCAVCEALLDHPRQPICPECRAALEFINPPLCTRCGQPVSGASLCAECRSGDPPFQMVRSVLSFGGSAQHAIARMKLSGKQVLAPFLAGLIADADLFGLSLPAQDLLVPIPLHRSRLAQRGFNQSVLLARNLSRRTGLELDLHHLLRRQKTPSQSQTKTRAERLTNVKGAFQVSRRHPFHGKRVCLVDDVVTTGATISACAATLRQAGAREVNAVTVARTIHL